MKLKFWIGILISIGCLYFVFRDINVARVFEAVQSVNYWYLAIAALLQIATIWLRAERWKYLLAPVKSLTFRQLVPATMIGFMANNILPARAGEFIRAYVVGKKEGISKTSSFATIIIERIFDIITMLVFLVLILFVVDFPETGESGTKASLISPVLLEKVGGGAAIFVVALVIFLVLMKEFPQQTERIVSTVLSPLSTSLTQKVIELLESFRSGLQVLQTGMHLFSLVFWSLSVWVTAVLAAWLVFKAFDLPLSIMASMFVVVITAFSAAIPASPGYVGPFHAAVKASVLFFLPGMDQNVVAGVAIIFHLVCVVPITVMGLYYLWKENMSFSEIRHIEEEETNNQTDLKAEAAN